MVNYLSGVMELVFTMTMVFCLARINTPIHIMTIVFGLVIIITHTHTHVYIYI